MNRKQYMADYWIRNPKKSQKQKVYYRKLRGIVLVHYSGLPPKCAICKTEDISKLIVVGNKELHGKGLYLWLIKQKFPNGYKILCRKCNK